MRKTKKVLEVGAHTAKGRELGSEAGEDRLILRSTVVVVDMSVLCLGTKVVLWMQPWSSRLRVSGCRRSKEAAVLTLA
jgi:hypothetical protein